MKKVVHRAEERGGGEHGWLTTRYSFSFADWYEPTRMGFGALRVINDDQIAPASGFPTHQHRDMEIITIVTAGAVSHKDSMGNVGTVKEGEVQAMSAGTGVAHSEYNDSAEKPLALFQIWIEPKSFGMTPQYGQRAIKAVGRGSTITPLVGPSGTPDALPINQDAYISRTVIGPNQSLDYELHRPGSGVYVFVMGGIVDTADETLRERDAIGVNGTPLIELSSAAGATALLIEVPME